MDINENIEAITNFLFIGDNIGRSLGMIDVGRPVKRIVKQLVGKKALKNHFKSLVKSYYEQTTNDLLDYTQETTQAPVIDLFVN